MGNLLSVEITAANVQDRDGVRLLLLPLASSYDWLKNIWADGGYAAALEGKVARLPRHPQIDLEIIKRSATTKGFEVLPQHWMVERTLNWLIQSRRLIRDHKVRLDHPQALIYLPMSDLMLTRITT